MPCHLRACFNHLLWLKQLNIALYNRYEINLAKISTAGCRGTISPIYLAGQRCKPLAAHSLAAAWALVTSAARMLYDA